MTPCYTESAPCFPPQKRGDTWRFQFRWGQSGGQPVNLTGCEARMQVRHAISKKLAAVPDSLVFDLSTGIVTATFLPATSAAVKPGTYLTDMEIEYADGYVQSCGTIQLPVVEDMTWPEES